MEWSEVFEPKSAWESSSSVPRNRDEERPQFVWPAEWGPLCVQLATHIGDRSFALSYPASKFRETGWPNAAYDRTAATYGQLVIDRELPGWRAHSPRSIIADYLEFLYATQSK
jgi:hypothetical protein